LASEAIIEALTKRLCDPACMVENRISVMLSTEKARLRAVGLIDLI
jgi:hypothetical protein